MASLITLTAAAVLDNAADHIDEYGWCNNGLYLDTTPPKPGEAPLPPKKCKVCADGAIAVGAGRHPEFGDSPITYAEHLIYDDETDDELLGEEDRTALKAIRAARKAFADHIRTKYREDCADDSALITAWNDEQDDASVVTAELRECAANLREEVR